MKSLTAELWFTGVYEPLGALLSVKGELALQQPNLFRVVVRQGRTPLVTLISDGKTLTTLLSQNREYTKEPSRAKLSDYWAGLESANGMFPGWERLSQRYLGKRTFGEEELEGIELAGQTRKTRVYFNKAGFPVRWIQTVKKADGNEVTSEIRLSKLEFNAKIPPETFVYTPPEGVTERKGKSR